MTHFLRAVRLALQHRITIAASFFCSLMVALLWGANVGAIYPIVEVVFRDVSMQEWIVEEISSGEEKISSLNTKIEDLQQQLAATGPEEEVHSLKRKINRQTSILEAEEGALAWSVWGKPLIDDYLPRTPFSMLLLVVGCLFAATMAKNFFLVTNMILIEHASQLSIFELRKSFFRQTLQMDLGSFSQNATPELMSRFTNDMNALASGINSLLGRMVREPLKMITCLIGAGFICWRLLLFSMIVTPLALFLIGKLAKSIKRANRRAMEEMAQLYSLISETFTGIAAVKAFTMERYERNRFHSTAKEYYRKAMKIVTYNALTKPTVELMGMGVICMAILSGAYLVLNGETHLFGLKMSTRELTFGSLMTFYAMLIFAVDPIRKLSDLFGVLQRGSAAADRIYEMLDRVPKIVDASDPKPIPDLFREIVFEGVDFHYTPGQPVLKNVDLRIRRGEKIAIVGANGCGKSTLTNLVLRFYDPIEGSVRIDETALTEFRVRDLRNRIGLVTQQTLLFNDTVMNNIRYGSSATTDQEVIEAAKKAHADRFIKEKLEQGYETVIGEQGGRLSGGQRQRIALARAILRDPDILILDEATSQIDIESEQLIHKALEKFIQGRTTIMITHRTSTLALADRILVMESGKIIDSGTHDQLLERCLLYQRLYSLGLKESA